MTVPKAVTGVLIGVGLMYGQGTSRGGSIAGKVLDSTGKDFANGAGILAMLRVPSPTGFKPHTAQTEAGRDGSYTLTGLPPGRYDVCVMAWNGDYVDECEWGKAAAVVSVGEGATAKQDLRLAKGVMIWVELADSQSLAEQHEGKSPGGFLDLSLITQRNETIRLKRGQEIAGKRSYWTIVPPGTKFRLEASSPLFDLESAEESGETLAALKAQREFNGSEGSKKLKLRIRGLKTVEVDPIDWTAKADSLGGLETSV
jgi:hypothetical protein